MGAALDRIAADMIASYNTGATKRAPEWDKQPAANQELARSMTGAVLDSIRQLDTTTAANVWKRLKVDPCAHGVTPDQATRALLDALFEELTA